MKISARKLHLFILCFFLGSGAIEARQKSFPSSAAPYWDYEDSLLHKNYSDYGKGRYPLDAKKHTQNASKHTARAAWYHAIHRLVEKTDFLRNYKRSFLPLLGATKPEWLNQARFAEFREKLQDETRKNWLFATVTAHMHQSRVPDAANLWFGVSHPVYDALFDDMEVANWSAEEKIERIGRIIKRDYTLENPSDEERLLTTIVKNLEDSIPPQNTELFFYYLKKLHEAQVDSLYQHKAWVSDLFLRRTTFRKGGYSMLLYALLADHHFTRYELDSFFLEGAFLQSLDDFNDIAEDQKQQIVTLASRRLITPNEEWEMRDLLFSRFRRLESGRRYTSLRVNAYFSALDHFIAGASAQYVRTLTGQ